MYGMNKRLLIQALIFIWVTCLLIGPKETVAEEIPKEFQPSSCVKIQGKTRDAVLASNMRFLITAQTRVFNHHGQEISIRALPVPCNAKVTYQPKRNSDPEALGIVVTQVLPGATTEWTSPSLSE